MQKKYFDLKFHIRKGPYGTTVLICSTLKMALRKIKKLTNRHGNIYSIIEVRECLMCYTEQDIRDATIIKEGEN